MKFFLRTTTGDFWATIIEKISKYYIDFSFWGKQCFFPKLKFFFPFYSYFFTNFWPEPETHLAKSLGKMKTLPAILNNRKIPIVGFSGITRVHHCVVWAIPPLLYHDEVTFVVPNKESGIIGLGDEQMLESSFPPSILVKCQCITGADCFIVLKKQNRK